MLFSPEDTEVLAGILEEAPDYLSGLEERILALEKERSEELLDSLFRTFHSLKGIAGFANLTPVVTVCHRAEDLVKELKSGKEFPMPTVVDALLNATDFVQQVLERIRKALETYSGGTLEITFTDFNEQGVVAKVESILAPGERVRKPVEESNKSSPLLDEELGKDVLRDFLGELDENLVCAEETLLRLEESPQGDEIDILMRAFHSIKGGARLILSLAPESSQVEVLRSAEKIAHHLEDLFQVVRDGKTPVDEELFRKTYQGIDLMKSFRHALETGQLQIPSEDLDVFLGVKAEQATQAEDTETLEAFLNIAEQFLEVWDEFLSTTSQEDLEHLVRLSGTVKNGLARLGLQGAVLLLEEIMTKAGEGDISSLKEARGEFVEHLESLKKKERKGKKAVSGTTASPVAKSSFTHTVRVDSEKLERMLNLVGELLTLKNATRSFVKKIEQEFSEVLPEAKNITSSLERLATDFQSIVLSLRMVPVGELFSRYRRTVRDLAKSLGKAVSLVIEGGETELDRTVIERLVDPLTHLVRNAVDHGIELPEERESSGKSREGKVVLRSYYRGAYAFVEVEDDGHGINAEAIRVKAVERGLVSPEQALRMSDQEVFSFLFYPGFSTAQAVSDISGRGVGMDVVKTNVEGMGGRVSVESNPGWGTTVRMRIPLSLLVVRGLMVRIAEERYIVPLDFIRETVKVPRERIREYFNGRFVEVRGEVLPLVIAEELLLERKVDLRARNFDFDLVPLMVVMGEIGTWAIAVDTFLEEGEYLVKSVPEHMRGKGLISGVTIMGDGSVVVILNPQEFMK